jgi:hypothetical protein
MRQVSAYAYTLGMVTMQLALPHSAVLTGLWCRAWQAGVAALGGCMLYALRGRINGRSVLPSAGTTVAAAFAGPKDH